MSFSTCWPFRTAADLVSWKATILATLLYCQGREMEARGIETGDPTKLWTLLVWHDTSAYILKETNRIALERGVWAASGKL